MATLNARTAERIRAVMAVQRISVADYARQMNRSVDMASRLVNDKVEFTLSDLENFSDLTGYTPMELLDDQFVLHPSQEVAA